MSVLSVWSLLLVEHLQMDTRYPTNGHASSEEELEGFAYQKEKAFLLKGTGHRWLNNEKVS